METRTLVVNSEEDFQLLNNIAREISWINKMFSDAEIKFILGDYKGSTQALIVFSHDGFNGDD